MCTGIEGLFATTAGKVFAAATAFSAISSIQQGQQEKKFANFQAEQANADAQAAREQGQVTAEKIRKAGKFQQAEAVAALAASGVEVTAGTPLRIADEIKKRVEQDAFAEMLTGQRQGTRLDQEAQGFRAAGKNAAARGAQRAVGSVLSAGAEYYGPKWNVKAPVEDRTNPPLNNPSLDRSIRIN